MIWRKRGCTGGRFTHYKNRRIYRPERCVVLERTTFGIVHRRNGFRKYMQSLGKEYLTAILVFAQLLLFVLHFLWKTKGSLQVPACGEALPPENPTKWHLETRQSFTRAAETSSARSAREFRVSGSHRKTLVPALLARARLHARRAAAVATLRRREGSGRTCRLCARNFS